MVLDRTHLKWGVATLIVTAGLTYIYLGANDLLPVKMSLPEWMGPVPPLTPDPGATPLGLICGSVALAIFIFAALLGARRSVPYIKLGRIQGWLKAHIWLTILTIPLVLFHCGFQARGPMTQFLMFLYALVMISGFIGWALQNIIPKMMQSSISQEIIYEQIPYVKSKLISDAGDELSRLKEGDKAEAVSTHNGHGEHGGAATAVAVAVVSPAKEALCEFIEAEAFPFLKANSTLHMRLRSQPVSDDLFRLARLENSTSLHPIINKIQELCDDKRRIDIQVKLHFWLHRWILFHAPASILLLVLTIWHAIVATYSYT